MFGMPDGRDPFGSGAGPSGGYGLFNPFMPNADSSIGGVPGRLWPEGMNNIRIYAPPIHVKGGMPVPQIPEGPQMPVDPSRTGYPGDPSQLGLPTNPGPNPSQYQLPGWTNLPSQIGNIIGPFAQAWSVHNQNNYRNAALATVLANLDNAYNNSNNMALGPYNRVGDMSAAMLSSPDHVKAILERGTENFDNLQSLLPGLFQNNPGANDESRWFMDQMNNRVNDLGALTNPLAYFVNNGGQTGDSRQGVDRALDIALGRGAPIDALQQKGLEGLTDPTSATSRQLAATAGQRLIGGGWTEALNGVKAWGAGAGNGVFGIGGMTPIGAAGAATALEGLLNGGASSYTNWTQSRGADLANLDAVMPLQTALSSAKDQAARISGGQAEAFRRQAAQRSGVPGTVLASGQQDSALADFADQDSQLQASMLQDALAKQQGLLLQQQQQGFNAANTGEALSLDRMKTLAGLLASNESAANQRLGLGMNSVLGAQNLANGQLADFGRLALGADQNDIARSQLGANMLGQYNQTRLSGLDSLRQMLGLEQNQFLGSGQLANQMYGQQLGGLNNIVQGYLSGQQLGNQNASALAQALLGNQSGLQGFGNLASTNALGNMNVLADLMRSWNQLGGQALGGMAGLYNRYDPGNTFGGFTGSGV